MRSHPIRRALIAALVLPLALASCSDSDPEPNVPGEPEAPGSSETSDPVEASAPEEPSPELSLSLSQDKDVVLAQTFSATVQNGDAQWVRVEGKRVGEIGQSEEVKVKLAGSLKNGEWESASYMEPSTRYTVRAKVQGQSEILKKSFTTRMVPLAKQTYPSLIPSGGTYGVGQPVVVSFDVPVTDRASVEDRLSIKTIPAQAGAWRWFSDTEVHWRPKTYWKPGTVVKYGANINSVPVGNGVVGQFDRNASFRVSGENKLVRVNLATRQLEAVQNGKVVRTIPISAGKPGFTTRSGTKVIMAKHRYYDMNSTSIGIDPNSSEGYDLSDVEYAMRLTNSGEFFHAAPWNAGLFGNANGSHGCTGLSTADAAWLYSFVDIGTPIEYTGSDYMMTLDNGWGDWNLPFKQYKQA